MPPTTLNAALARHVAERPDAEFGRWLLRDQEQVVSYQDLHDEAARIAALLASRGIGRGDTVLIILPSGPALWFAFLGALRLGAVPSFMPGPSPKQDPARYWHSHAALFQRIGHGALLTHAEHVAALDAHLPDQPQLVIDIAAAAFFTATAVTDATPAPDDVALLQHSSGTTGLKKGVALSHAAILRQLTSYSRRLELRETDRIASWLPLYHDMGLIACFLLPLVSGVPVVMLDPFEWVAAPKRLFGAITQSRATLVWQPNFAFQHLCRAVRASTDHDLSGVRAWINCSEPCRAETFEQFAQRFAPIGVRLEQLQVCYAMAETVFAVSQSRPGRPNTEITVDADVLRETGRVQRAHHGQRFLSAGSVIDGLTVRITNADGEDLPDAHVGVITIAGDCLFEGYHRQPLETAKKLRDGWYRTGDLGFLLDGELYLTGRENDLIIVHGKNYYAHELEFLLNQIPGLHPGRNVAAGWFRAEVGSEDVIIIAESDTSDPTELARAIRNRLQDEAGLHPYDVRIVPPGWLIKTTSGKIARGANLDRYLAERDAPTPLAHAA